MSDKNAQCGTPKGCRFKIASVRLLDVPFHIDKNFDYRVVEGMTVSKGDFVAVPFGGGNRPQTGLVVAVRGSSDDICKLKPIHTVLDKAYSLSEEQMGLTEFLRDLLSRVLQCALPVFQDLHQGANIICRTSGI